MISLRLSVNDANILKEFDTETLLIVAQDHDYIKMAWARFVERAKQQKVINKKGTQLTGAITVRDPIAGVSISNKKRDPF